MLLTALGTGAAIGVFSAARVPEAVAARHGLRAGRSSASASSSSSRPRSTSAASPRCSSPAVGACAGARVRHRLHGAPGDVTDELRGRTFATLYAVVRLCLLLSLTVSPLFADLYDWLFSLVSSAPARHSSAGSATASRACGSRCGAAACSRSSRASTPRRAGAAATGERARRRHRRRPGRASRHRRAADADPTSADRRARSRR